MPAHLFALQAKLRAYQGPAYEGGMLDEAEILADQILRPISKSIRQRRRGTSCSNAC
jgi:hypothetical protein